MKKILSTLILVHFILSGDSQQVVVASYPAAGISESLKKDANAVYRLDEGILEVISASKYTLKTHQVITVLNEEGARHLQQTVWFDKFNAVDDIEVKLYNSAGNEIQKYKKKDFTVENYFDGISLATDDKMMHLTLAAREYPCTVDVEYVMAVSSYIDLPNWYMNNTASSIEQFKYTVKVPAGMDIRYRTLNMDIKPVIADNPKGKVYTWETKNVAVNKMEAGGYEGSKYLPQVEVSPNVFEYDGHKGEFKNWADFGKWCYSLYEEKTGFSEQRTAEIKAMVNGQPDAQSKIKVLYDYLKKNMRYVSIQFGIGGYKPFTTRFVDDKKYGDCKALTNYMRNLLSVVGIKSYPALINAGYNKAPANPEFPENIFNHVILCVPQAKDSIWLECTSNNSDAGFLGSFTENKNALLLTENGGVIVPTPRSNFNQNLLETVNDIFINEEGGAEVKSRINSSGSFYELLDAVTKTEGARQNELFVNYLHYKEPDELKLTEENESNGHRLSLHFVYAKLFDFKAGSKFFFPKSISTLSNDKLATQETRKTEYLFQYPYKKVDTTIFHLPTTFKVDDLPKEKELAGDCISYSRQVNYEQASNTIKIVSTLILNNNIIKADEYKDICRLLNLVEKEETNKLVLKKE